MDRNQPTAGYDACRQSAMTPCRHPSKSPVLTAPPAQVSIPNAAPTPGEEVCMPPHIDIPPTETLERYFLDEGLADVLEAARPDARGPNELESAEPYPPDLVDLYRLHRLVRTTGRTTVLEFGIGWSTYIFAHALARNAEEFGHKIGELRRSNPFEVHAVDNEAAWVNIALSRLPSELCTRTAAHVSNVRMGQFNDRICTFYDELPVVSPDLIYLDGPDQFNIIGEVAGWSSRHNDMVPMAADLLRIEHYLLPGTIIVVDGRAANARFLRANFQREWNYRYDSAADQHVFEQREDPLGRINARQLAFFEDAAAAASR